MWQNKLFDNDRIKPEKIPVVFYFLHFKLWNIQLPRFRFDLREEMFMP
jgi:hypothetical protein